MKQKPKREFITDIKPFAQFETVQKRARKNQKNFKLTNSLLKSVYARAKKVQKKAELILTIPANQRENYIVKCYVTKQQKV